MEGNTCQGAGCFLADGVGRSLAYLGAGLLELAGLSASELQALMYACVFGRAERELIQMNNL